MKAEKGRGVEERGRRGNLMHLSFANLRELHKVYKGMTGMRKHM